MRLLSVYSLLIFTLCLLLIKGKFYDPKRPCNSTNDPEIDGSSDGCRKACNAACAENCEPELCEEFGADFARSRTSCFSCICPEGL